VEAKYQQEVDKSQELEDRYQQEMAKSREMEGKYKQEAAVLKEKREMAGFKEALEGSQAAAWKLSKANNNLFQDNSGEEGVDPEEPDQTGGRAAQGGRDEDPEQEGRADRPGQVQQKDGERAREERQ